MSPTPADWSHQDETMTTMEPSSDLFDGDILGDELIDIYNAAVVGGGDDDDDAMNEIPALLAPSTELKDVSVNQPGTAVASATATIDDGLGAFRPSTSFNDLSTLQPPESTTVDPNKPKVVVTDPAPAPPLPPPAVARSVVALEPEPKPTPVASTVGAAAPIPAAAPVAPTLAPAVTVPSAPIGTTTAPTSPKTKKRKEPVTAADGPASKRKNTGKKGAAATKSKTKKDVASKATFAKQSKATKPTKSIDDTPNPLTPVEAQPQPVTAVKAVQQPVQAIVKPDTQASSSVATTPVVTPRVQETTGAPKTEVKPPTTKPAAVAPAPATTTSSAASTSSQPTEADFQSVAQAAVSNLIMNAGNASSDASKDASGAKVDTSSEHIKALTGSNWVAVCNGGELAGAQPPASPSDKMNNRARRQNLTADERARQNRDRNREHARNTRLRKKAYVEELKRTLTALVAQRDATDLEKRHSTQRELEQREVRFRVVEEFLKLRGRNEANFARWAAILEDNFRFVLPVTGYRDMVQSKSKAEKGSYQQVLTGVSEAVADSALLSSFLKTLGNNSLVEPVYFQYQCDRKNFFMDNCTAVLDWTASSQGVIRQGATNELTLKGNLKASFSPASNKLISVVISFDTGMITAQLNQMKSPVLPGVEAAAVTAAEVAANEADAILDSLNVPHIEAAAAAAAAAAAPSSLPSNVVTVVPPSCSGSSTGPASITDVEREDSSIEDCNQGDLDDAAAAAAAKGMTTRRVQRRKD